MNKAPQPILDDIKDLHLQMAEVINKHVESCEDKHKAGADIMTAILFSTIAVITYFEIQPDSWLPSFNKAVKEIYKDIIQKHSH